MKFEWLYATLCPCQQPMNGATSTAKELALIQPYAEHTGKDMARLTYANTRRIFFLSFCLLRKQRAQASALRGIHSVPR